MNSDGIDETLYSRQLYVLGKDAMKSIKQTSVLISGLTGVGIEIAKCIILAGVESVTLHDTENITMKDLASNYYAHENNIGFNRAETVHKNLAQLNPYVNVTTNTNVLTEDHFNQHKIIVMCDNIITNYTYYNIMAREYKTHFIVANTFGVLGYIFCDFGKKFIVKDLDGETEKSGIIINCKNNCFTTNEPHELSVNDIVDIQFDDNIYRDNILKIIDTNTFTTCHNIMEIEQISNISNISFKQIKKPQTMHFKPMLESMKNPDFGTIISSDFERQTILHNFNIALSMFINHYKRMPEAWDENDANIIVKLFGCECNNVDLVKKLSYTCKGKISSLDYLIGSIAGQEVIKAASGKFTPIKQWLYFDAVHILQKEKLEKNVNFKYSNRYSAQTLILGDEIQNKIHNSKIFIVGAGAIGCEHLKNFAMMGIKNIVITDMDRIEKSNLNRQFLFKASDIGKFKSDASKEAIKIMNSDINVESQINKVSSETLSIYSNKFFSDITAVTTALDNIQARLFVDNLCLENKIPLIDSGTLGTKGNVQVVLPYITETYGSSSDPPEQTIHVCTLKMYAYILRDNKTFRMQARQH